jgi:hypothetical protein
MSDKDTKLVGGLPVAQLKTLLAQVKDDNLLAEFLQSYALGFAADQFIAGMVRPNERAAFLIAVAQQYPTDWALAVSELSKAKV